MAADFKGLQNSVKSILLDEIKKFKEIIRTEGKIFLYVGQIIPRKGVIELLKVWHQFTAEVFEEVTLILLGGGSKEKEAREYISANALLNVRITGQVDYSEVVKYYAAADIFIMPTLEDNWSLVVPEAMSCGLPVLCSKYNGCWPELVKPENGWVFDPLNEDNFIGVLKAAWDNRNAWNQMGQESLRIVQDYTPEKVAGNIYNACLSVLAK